MNTFVVPSFNPLQFANRLKEAGVPEKQAEAEAEVLHNVLSLQAQAISALEGQVKTLAADAKRDAENNASKGDIALVRKDMEVIRKDMETMEDRLVIRLTKVMMTVAGITVAVVGCAAGIARLLMSS